VEGNPEDLSSFETAHHQLMYELVEAQRHSLNLIQGEKKVQKIFVDGGFSQNELYLKMLAAALPEKQVIAAEAASGSALGAALAVRGKDVPAGFLKEHYRLKSLDV
jgi:sugar (pentulose or hexulose) kinase